MRGGQSNEIVIPLHNDSNLESSHPLRPPDNKIASIMDEQLFYTHECKDNEIAYFKVDVNLIAGLDCSYLGLVFENYALKHVFKINFCCHFRKQGSTNHQVREPTGPNRAEIFKILMVLIRSSPRF